METRTIYRIKDWERLFENSESRKVKQVRWVAIPNKFDGKGYRRLLKLPDAPGMFGAWVLILEVASRCPTRGLLVDDDGPIDADDLADKTGYPVELFKNALKALTDQRIGWIEEVNESDNLPASPDAPGNAGVEGKGREQKGREDNTGGGAAGRAGKPKQPKAAASAPIGFTRFWSAYPSRGRERSNRADALKAWNKLALEPKADEIISALEAWKLSAGWQKDGGEFIKGVHRWLADEKFNDLPQPASNQEPGTDVGSLLGEPRYPTDEDLDIAYPERVGAP